MNESAQRHASRDGPAPYTLAASGVLRVLAVVDAVFVQAVGMWWIAQQPHAGGPLGLPVVVVLAVWAIRRAWRAILEPETYEWMVFKIGRWLILLAGVGLIVQLWRWGTGS